MERIFRFSSDHCDWKITDQSVTKKHLGGKGAALAMMAQAGMPVPPGFTITTDTCNEYRKLLQDNPDKVDEWIDALMGEVLGHMDWLSKQFGYTPLVSVRSGAPISMPGMMDTILNVGLTNENLPEWEERLGKRAAMDSMRRLIQMLGSTAYGVPHEVFEFQLAKHKKAVGAESDTDLTAADLEFVSQQYLKAFFANKGFDFPIDDPYTQLRSAVLAVFDSWMNPRAIEYRKLNGIPEDMGTAVNVQAMVFGNMGEDSGTGVLFTRCPSTGKNEIMGEFLQNAQGEDVVAGIRTPRPLTEMVEMGAQWKAVYHALGDVCVRLEDVYRDMVDVEFTVQNGSLFILQSRVGKRSAIAAFRIAVDLVEEGVIDRDTALSRLKKAQFKVVRRPMLDPNFKEEPDFVGLPACPGVVSGKPVFSAEDAVNCTEPCILISHETTPDDIAGMNAAVGILTQTGGATSHAAVVARAMDKPCVVGCTTLDIDALKGSGCTKITIDGSTGNVWVQTDVPVIDSSDDPAVRTVMNWCMEKLGAWESSPVDLGSDHRPHVVQAAYWWGSLEVAEAVVEGIKQMPSRENVKLDIRNPQSFMPETDNELTYCFGTEPDSDVAFKKEFGQLLNTLIKDFPDLDIVGAGGVPLIVPADYAAFSVLAD